MKLEETPMSSNAKGEANIFFSSCPFTSFFFINLMMLSEEPRMDRDKGSLWSPPVVFSTRTSSRFAFGRGFCWIAALGKLEFLHGSSTRQP
ncbi:hypothetical protein BJY04DRAFT_183072 [Aspergillus karnatakaensis]|uniref:uncharacterized protein n=1 Tax=Aspergillus karnatakaensis TaxID=1810916 RepID=UPI003CCCD4F0